MKKSTRLLFVAVVLAAVMFAWGIFVGHYHVWPFSVLHGLKVSAVGTRPEAQPWPPAWTPSELWSMSDERFRAIRGDFDVVMLGDSLTNGGRWSELLNRIVANRGIGGDTTTGVLARLDEVSGRHPRVVLVMLGINDLMGSRSVDEIVRNYRLIITGLQEAGATVIVQSTLLPGAQLNDLADPVRSLNAALQSMAIDLGVAFIDLNAKMAPDGVLLDTTDGIHLTGAGYATWAAAIRDAVQ
ncbi:MAG: hypothetical protein KDA44_09375 [Planctomycetales bacterium]|nr:hypothetical protein [Planctomycetales bacterium]